MSKLTGKELAKEFESFVNGTSDFEKQEFVKGFMSMHNTLEQSAFGVLLKVVEAMSKKSYVDGRNQASKQRAEWMVEGIKQGAVADLKENDPYYWREDRAKEWVYGENYDISSLPFI